MLVGLLMVWFVSISFMPTQNQAWCSVSLYARSHHSSLTTLVTTVPTLSFHADHPSRQRWQHWLLNSGLPVNSSSSLSIPLSFLIAPPRTCSATVHGHCYVGLFSAYISMDHSAHWSFQTLLVCRHLGFLSTLFMVHPIFLRQPVHDTIRLSKSIFCFISEIAHVLFYIILWIHVWSIL